MKGFYDPNNLHHPREIAGSSLRPLSKIPHCCLQRESGPYLSPSVTGHPLRPVKDHRLGGPFPHQQSNLTQAHQKTIHISFFIPDLQEFFGRFLRVTHPFAMLKKAFDLHVLSFSLAFILSQDQTHRFKQYKIKKKKESIQLQVPLQLPCYDFTTIINRIVKTSFKYDITQINGKVI